MSMPSKYKYFYHAVYNLTLSKFVFFKSRFLTVDINREKRKVRKDKLALIYA